MRILLAILAALAIVSLIELFSPPSGFWLVATLLVLIIVLARGGFMFVTGHFQLHKHVYRMTLGR